MYNWAMGGAVNRRCLDELLAGDLPLPAEEAAEELVPYSRRIRGDEGTKARRV